MAITGLPTQKLGLEQMCTPAYPNGKKLLETAKVLRKVHIDKFDSTVMQWSRWQDMFELQMLANEILKSFGLNLQGII